MRLKVVAATVAAVSALCKVILRCMVKGVLVEVEVMVKLLGSKDSSLSTSAAAQRDRSGQLPHRGVWCALVLRKALLRYFCFSMNIRRHHNIVILESI